jgi:RNA polymerase sigma-54 factor
MVADAVGLHESTVSRATANKTMQTPRGLFEMKYFFSSSIPAMSGGDMHSAEAVKHRIRSFIAHEPPDNVLSDDALVVLLGRDGIDIARRTVAKYREMMRIGSSVERRRQRRLLEAS